MSVERLNFAPLSWLPSVTQATVLQQKGFDTKRPTGAVGDYLVGARRS